MEREYDILPYPHELIAGLGCDNSYGISALRRSCIAVTAFKCKFFGTGEPWDIGCCLGYTIYASPNDLAILKCCEALLSRLSNALASPYYNKNDLRPYGIVIVRPHTDIGQCTIDQQIAFLDSCYHL